MTDWAEGRECDKHEMSYCADCRDAAGIRRDATTGQVGYKKDCAVQSFIELTGASYDEAVEHLTAVGFRPGIAGTPAGAIVDALTAVGYTVRETPVRYGDLRGLRGAYVISGRQGSGGHSWTVIDGTVNRGYRGRFTYRVWKVTA